MSELIAFRFVTETELTGLWLTDMVANETLWISKKRVPEFWDVICWLEYYMIWDNKERAWEWEDQMKSYKKRLRADCWWLDYIILYIKGYWIWMGWIRADSRERLSSAEWFRKLKGVPYCIVYTSFGYTARERQFTRRWCDNQLNKQLCCLPVCIQGRCMFLCVFVLWDGVSLSLEWLFVSLAEV